MKFRENVNTDLISGIVGMVILAVFWSAKKDVGRLSIMFPNSLLILVGIFSGILLVKGFIKAERRTIFSDSNQTRIIFTGLFLFAWVFGIMFLGFLVASLVIFPALVCYLASAREKLTLKKTMLWALISSVEIIVFYLIFSRLLEVPLPTGFFI